MRIYGRRLTDAELERVRAGEDQGVRLRARIAPLVAVVGQPATLQLEVQGPGDVEVAWSFDDGSGWQPGGPGGSVTHTWTEPGHHEVVASVTNGLQRVSAVRQVTVHRPLAARPPVRSSTVAIDDVAREAWVVLRDHGALARVDLDARTLVETVDMCAGPRSVTMDASGTPWVACPDEDLVVPLPGSGEPALHLPAASRPVGVVHDAARDTLWVALEATGQLRGFGPHPVTVDLGGRPSGLSVAPDGRVWVTRFLSPDAGGELWVYDPDTDSLDGVFVPTDTTTVDAEDRSRGVPNHLAVPTVSPDGAQVWVPAKLDNVLRGQFRDGRPLTFESSVRSMVARVEPDGVVLDRLDLNNRAPGVDLAFSPAGDWAFVVTQGNHRVEILDAYSGEPVGALLDAGHAPDGVAITAEGDLAVVSGNLSRTVLLYDLSDLSAGQGLATPLVAELPVPLPEPLDPIVLAGKRVFHDAQDPRMSRDGYISCAVCHADGGEDGRVWDFTDRGEGLRNTIDLRGRAGMGHGPVHWTANFDEIQDFENDIRGAFGGRGYLEEALWQEGTRRDPLGDPKSGLSPELDALAAYVATFATPPPSPWRDPDAALDTLPGAALFEDLGCVDCHGGPEGTISDGSLFDVGTLTAASGLRRGGPLEGLDVPSLDGVWATPPYLHDGSAPTLREVLTTRNPADAHGVTSPLDDEALDDLVAYLLALDGRP